MWNADAERSKLELDIAVSWWQAQRLVWHSPAWDGVMGTIARLERDLGRLNGLECTVGEGEDHPPLGLIVRARSLVTAPTGSA